MNFFTAILKCICSFWTFLESEMTDFPTFPHTPTSEIRTLPFHLLEACMKKIKLDIPFGAEPTRKTPKSTCYFY